MRVLGALSELDRLMLRSGRIPMMGPVNHLIDQAARDDFIGVMRARNGGLLATQLYLLLQGTRNPT